MTKPLSLKYNKWFDSSHLANDLKSNSIKGGFNTIVGQILSFVLNITATIIMARLLIPGDYGLVAMVTTVTGFIAIFKDMGLSEAIVQRRDLQQDQVSAIFWVNVCLCFFIALFIALIGPLLVSFYQEERLLNLTYVFAASLFFTGLSLQHNALLKRQMKFKTLTKIQISSNIVSIIIGVGLAWQGFGYWAVVATTISNPIFSTISLWIVCDWRPNLNFKTQGIKSLLTFGAGITGFSVVNYFSRNMDNLLIGKFSGPGVLGIYTKAYQLLLLPITQLRDPLNAVALPALSNLQHDKWKYNHFFKRYLFTLAFFSMPLVVFSAVFSDEIVLLVLGEKWIASSLIFKLLSISALIQPVASTQGLLLITTGKTKRFFYLGIMNSSITVLGFCIGINWGVTGIAISYAIVNYVVFIPFLMYCLRDSPLTVVHFLEEVIWPGVFAILMGISIYAMRLLMLDLHPLLICSIGLLTGSVVYLSLWAITNKTRIKMKQIIEIGSFLLEKYKSK